MAEPEKQTQNNLTYISETEANRRGYGSRSSINRWVNEGSVRALKVGGTRMVCEEDVQHRSQERVTLDVDKAYDALAARVASLAPAFSDDQKQRLVQLLSV